MLKSLCFAAAFALSATSGFAAVTTYTSASAFHSALSGYTIFAVSPPAETYDGPYANFALGPVTITTPGTLYRVNDGSYGSSYLDALGGTPNAASAAIGASYHAIGFEIGTFDSPDLVSVIINGVGGYSFSTSGHPGTSFFGITSDSDITSVDFQLTVTSELDLVSVTAGTIASGVPEPATWLAMALGFGALGASLRKRQQRSAIGARRLGQGDRVEIGGPIHTCQR